MNQKTQTSRDFGSLQETRETGETWETNTVIDSFDLSGGGRRHSDGAWVQWTGAFFEHDTWQVTPCCTIDSSQPMEECGASIQMVNLNHNSFVYRVPFPPLSKESRCVVGDSLCSNLRSVNVVAKLVDATKVCGMTTSMTF